MALDASNKIINSQDGIVVDGTSVEGGYFVTPSIEITSTGEAGKIPSYACIEGALCYCTGDSKFYQHDGTTWVEAKLGGGLGDQDVLKVINPIAAEAQAATRYYDLKPEPSGQSGYIYWRVNPSYNWSGFEIKEGYRYTATVEPHDAGGNGNLPMATQSVLLTDTTPVADVGLDNATAINSFTDIEFMVASGTTTTLAQDFEGNFIPFGYGILSFIAPYSGYAFIQRTDGTDLHTISISETNPNSCETGKVVIDGNLEISGDINFGTDSHFAFGTVEGTDFIADHAKVKNAPVEDDDVVNLKTLREWVPSGTNSKKYLLVAMSTGGAAGSYTLNNLPYSTLMNHYDSSRDIAQGTVVLKTGTTYYLELDIITGDEGAVTAELTTPTGDPGTTMILTFTAHDGGSYSFPTFLTGQFTEDGSTFTAAINCQNVPVFGNISIYSLESATGSSDISDYQGNAKINGNLEVTGNLSFDGDLEMSSIEAQSIKINGKRVLTEDDLANLVAYPAAEDYTF